MPSPKHTHTCIQIEAPELLQAGNYHQKAGHKVSELAGISAGLNELSMPAPQCVD